MLESDVIYFMNKPYAMTSSDGEIPVFGQGLPHPRNYGAFTRNIRKYVFEEKIISMEHAIRAASGLPAEMLGFQDRGLLKEGHVADIVVFSPDKLKDIATFTNPHQYSKGIDYVLISGKLVIDRGKYTGVLAGKPIKRQ
jgi:N-acyl-D-amino-acid deacylase